MPASTMPRPAGVNGTAVRSEPVRATKNAPLIPRCTPGNARAATTKYRRKPSVDQIRPVRNTRIGTWPRDDGREDAFLELVVQLDVALGDRQRTRGSAARSCAATGAAIARKAITAMPIANTIWTSVGSRPRKLMKPAARPSTTIANRSRTRSMKIGPEGPADRHAGIQLEQVGPVDVAQLGRHEAVHEPRQEDDLGRVLGLERVAGGPDQERPSDSRASGKPG